MSKLTKDQADNLYDQAVQSVANGLRALASDVERLGRSHLPVPGRPHDERHNRVWAASEVHNKVLSWLGQHNGALMLLWWYAMEAEHPTARSTPAELLDQAATAVDANLDAKGAPDFNVDPVTIAEAALRGAGVIR